MEYRVHELFGKEKSNEKERREMGKREGERVGGQEEEEGEEGGGGEEEREVGEGKM